MLAHGVKITLYRELVQYVGIVNYDIVLEY